MSTDALAPCIARTSTAMILTVQARQVLVSSEEGFQLRVSSQCSEISAMRIILFIFP